ncbi:MAG: hypothetical protein CMF46_05085 [Legionellales bacterium]|nr:hypothetical protein [Legionellales bacterium]|tara:strand:+ start:949 stop:1236 length:288 start_codon:yes stop_codon:yes gene_type:complete
MAKIDLTKNRLGLPAALRKLKRQAASTATSKKISKNGRLVKKSKLRRIKKASAIKRGLKKVLQLKITDNENKSPTRRRRRPSQVTTEVAPQAEQA